MSVCTCIDCVTARAEGPTEAEVRGAYILQRRSSPLSDGHRERDEFNRWLARRDAAVEAKARAEGRREVIEYVNDNPHGSVTELRFRFGIGDDRGE